MLFHLGFDGAWLTDKAVKKQAQAKQINELNPYEWNIFHLFVTVIDLESFHAFSAFRQHLSIKNQKRYFNT